MCASLQGDRKMVEAFLRRIFQFHLSQEKQTHDVLTVIFEHSDSNFPSQNPEFSSKPATHT